MTEEFRRKASLEAGLADEVRAHVCDRLGLGRRFCGLRWSAEMPVDDTDADLLVVDEAGTEYTLELDVTLWPTN